jgi:dihydropteroate synthase
MISVAESNVFSRKYSLNIHGRLLDLRTPKVMGILNATPDSFYSGTRVQKAHEIVAQAAKMIEEGAFIIDVGAASTRPGAAEVPAEMEKSRALLAITEIIKHFPEATISCDTYRSEVAIAAVGEGAVLINDISGGELDDKMFETIARLQVPYILMHMRGTPANMSTLNHYENIHLEIIHWLQQRLRRLAEMGVNDVIVDPGFGFAKSIRQNFEIINNLELYHSLDKPLMAGISRKSLIWKTLGITPDQALNGTSVLNSVALLKGVSLLRVHDVKEAVEAVKLIGEVTSHQSVL